MFQQVIKALKDMKYIKAIHRDIKNANILLHFPEKSTFRDKPMSEIDLLEDEVEVKLADFGFSTIL